MTERDRINQNSESDFSLEKYYVDLVTAEGHYFIGYSARLNWRAININYRATLHHPSFLGVNAGPSLSSRDGPVDDDSVLTWRSHRLGFDGQWRRLVSAERHVLHQEDDGFVDWNCSQPSAQVQLTTASGTTFHGIGYVECLKLTIPPWRLGLRTLLWGHFASEDHSVVWIEWQGKRDLKLLICDGQRAVNPEISDNCVKCEDFELSLERAELIREDSIGERLVSKIPAVLKAAPIEFLGGREQKYVCRGRLAFAGGLVHTGWVIHESVTWGKDSI